LKIRGRAITVGDNIDTDQIIPAVYLTSTDPAELAKHCLEGYDEEFPSKIKEGDILVAGKTSAAVHPVSTLLGR